MTAVATKKTWRDYLAEDLAKNPPAQQRSNLEGILYSRPHGGWRLAKQTECGDEYVVFDYDQAAAWRKLAQVTGRLVRELKNLPMTRM
jgi:hypothetical protein